MRLPIEKIKNLYVTRSTANYVPESPNARGTYFYLMSTLCDVDKLRLIAGKRLDTDTTLYYLALNNDAFMENLAQVIDVKSLADQLNSITKEVKILETKSMLHAVQELSVEEEE